ncbi:MAG: L-arabinose transport system permease protein AraQ [Phycisphaerae bacterium]|nr:L-arabinose transport system permease protein AraQ [Phycisphaerae bacterium]
MRKLWRYLLLIIVGVLLALPLLAAFSTSLQPLEQVYNPRAPLWPAQPQWDNYQQALIKLPYNRFLLNSLILSLLAVVGTLWSTSLAGYALARLRWRGRSLCLALVLIVLVIPGHVYLIPHFLLFKTLGWMDSYKPLIVPSFLAVEVFYIFLFRQFFRQLPSAYSDLGRIDGASEPQVFWRIIMPLSKPAIVTVLALNFAYHWQDFLHPLIYLQSVELFPLPLGLRMYRTLEGDWVNYLMAASLLSLIPAAIILFITQRYLLHQSTVIRP